MNCYCCVAQIQPLIWATFYMEFKIGPSKPWTTINDSKQMHNDVNVSYWRINYIFNIIYYIFNYLIINNKSKY